GASDRAGFDLDHGGAVTGVCSRLLCRLLDQDQPALRETPSPAVVCAEPAQEAQRCPRGLKPIWWFLQERPNTARKSARSCCGWRIAQLRRRWRGGNRPSQRPTRTWTRCGERLSHCT